MKTQLNQALKQRAAEQAQAVNLTPRSVVAVICVGILVDATGSMERAIAAVKRSLCRHIDVIHDSDFEPYVGLVIFRDESHGEKTYCYPIGSEPEKLKSILSRTEAVGGVDIPESSLPAIMHGLALPGYKDGAQKVILHITDAPPHDPEAGHTSASVLQALKQNDVLYYACAPKIEPYVTFANATGGELIPFRDDLSPNAFDDLLVNIAHTTVKTVRMKQETLSDDAMDLLKRTRIDG